MAAWIMATGSLASAIMGPIALTVAFSGRAFAIRLACAFLGLWCLAYAVSASLGFVATARDTAVAERAAVAESAAERRARFDLAKSELATLKGQTRTVLQRRRELEATLRETASRSQTAILKPIGAVDPQAATLAYFLKAAGYAVTPAGVSRWLEAFTVAFFEVAASFALVASRAASEPPRPVAPRPVPEAPRPAEAPVGPAEASRKDDQDPPPPPPRKGKPGPGRKPNATPAEVVAELRTRGGKVAGSLNGLGKTLGTKSKTATHRTLMQCAALGLVTLTTSPHGVAVALA
jgi:hypothetical protein